ncbi:holin [Aeromonas phage 2_D05]|uniref:Holin n=1 Tax=Aeromonas phage 2_D05 TaxID=2588098 RepID=A0A4Y5TWQ2_9CAUD|nr:holin [Aeromonas phage 2_D05]QDB73833.1 hypothetical protein 2D05_002 [Aeromonas phage 2_D05]
MLKLIDNWRVAHKFTSMQLMAFAGACDIILAGVVIVNQQFPFDPLWYVVGRLALTGVSMGARLVAQQAGKQ